MFFFFRDTSRGSKFLPGETGYIIFRLNVVKLDRSQVSGFHLEQIQPNQKKAWNLAFEEKLGIRMSDSLDLSSHTNCLTN